jgi:hypothetical protein
MRASPLSLGISLLVLVAATLTEHFTLQQVLWSPLERERGYVPFRASAGAPGPLALEVLRAGGHELSPTSSSHNLVAAATAAGTDVGTGYGGGTAGLRTNDEVLASLQALRSYLGGATAASGGGGGGADSAVERLGLEIVRARAEAFAGEGQLHLSRTIDLAHDWVRPWLCGQPLRSSGDGSGEAHVGAGAVSDECTGLVWAGVVASLWGSAVEGVGCWLPVAWLSWRALRHADYGGAIQVTGSLSPPPPPNCMFLPPSLC